ncbi:MAG: hypothetical protein GY832_06720 [Chloroflexi bacterium]|nr:hypothetical protein [Chloroflexota bacterium]
MMKVEMQTRIEQAVLKLDAWLDSMRASDGYGGPVAHWWQNSLQFTGAGLDWRYEGIIIGYLNLYGRTDDEQWLDKARRAGDDLARGQLPSGNFRDSCFELNPHSGGTPHEAACDYALLRLAQVLRARGDNAWEQYALVAERNLRGYYLERLWDDEAGGFGNSPNYPAFTPNKSATTVEALFALATLQQDDKLIEQYALPTLDTILRHQAPASDYLLDGAIDQSSLAGKGSSRFFPFYVARCIPALLEGYSYTQHNRYLQAAQRAMSFVLRCRLPDGSFPQVVYGDGRTNRYPQWIAGVGDILRAMRLMSETGMEIRKDNTLTWMLNGQNQSGGIHTGHGFAAQVSQRKPTQLPEFRDVLPVCGWVDKAFRYLTSRVQGDLKLGKAAANGTESACVFRGQIAKYREDAVTIELWVGEEIVYQCRKGSAWAEICVPGGGVK